MATDIEVLRGLANELTSALADMVGAVNEGQAHAGEIGTTLAEMLEVLKGHKEPAPPEITVNVPPPPAPQIAIFQSESNYEVDHEYDSGGRLVKSHVKRVSKGE